MIWNIPWTRLLLQVGSLELFPCLEVTFLYLFSTSILVMHVEVLDLNVHRAAYLQGTRAGEHTGSHELK